MWATTSRRDRSSVLPPRTQSGCSRATLRLGVDRVEEGIDQLSHAVLAEIVAGGAEVGAVPIARPIPPAPVAVVDVAARCSASGRPRERPCGTCSAGPGCRRPLTPGCPSRSPCTSSPACGWRETSLRACNPTGSDTANRGTSLPASSRSSRNRPTNALGVVSDWPGGQRLLVAGDLEPGRDRTVGGQSERRAPVAEVVPANDEPLAGIAVQQGVPGGVGRTAHAETVAAAAARPVPRVADRSR